METPSFHPLVSQDEPLGIPLQNLHLVLLFIAEQEGVPAEEIDAVFSLQNCRKAVDALAHVPRTVGQKDRFLLLNPVQEIM